MIKVTTRGLGFGGQVMLWQRTGEPVRDAYLDVVGAIDCYEYYHDAAQGEYRRQQYVYAGEDHELHCLGLGLAVGPLSMSMIVDDLAASLGDVERRWWLSARQDVVALGRAMAVAGLAPWFAGIRDRRGPREAGRQLALAVGRLVHHLRGTRLQRVRELMGTVPRDVAAGVRDADAPRRVSAAGVDPLEVPLLERVAVRKHELRARRAAEYVAEVRRRGGEVDIEGAYGTEELEMVECWTHRHDQLALLRCEGWRQYSRAYGARRARLAYLCGLDDNGPFAVRVPGSCESVAEALTYVEPPEVRRAREAGRAVLRQGDVYAVATRRASDGRGLADLEGTRHVWDAETRVLHHGDPSRPHMDLHVPFPALFVRQRAYQMGRTSRRGFGD